jgi:iron complex transport system ATP-binding protein
MAPYCLETTNLDIGYHSRSSRAPVASGLNLHLHSGQLTCLIGPNGTGKSTLLRTLAGLQKPLKGMIRIDGQPIEQFRSDELARRISIVLTDSAHPGDLRVDQVVELGRLPYSNWLGSLSQQDHLIVEEAIKQVDAGSLMERSFGELSDGERQKVMIARALAQDTIIMILDEPTAFLDWSNRVDLLVSLKRIAAETGKAILISSHDLELVLQIADEIWLMDAQKKIVTGTSRELLESGSLERVFSGQHRQFHPLSEVARNL